MTNLEKAVGCVKALMKVNGWSLYYCIGLISKWHRIDFFLLMSACGKDNKGKSKKSKKKFKSTEEAYGGSIPYWIN